MPDDRIAFAIHPPIASRSVHIMRAKLTWRGSVEARDKHEAMDKAMRELNIREADRFRISVRRE
jgi:hypothetical protein